VTSVAAPLRRAFICYRSDDTGAVADRLASELRRELECEVFLDHRSLEGGDTWPERLRAEVERADVVLVLIGRQWLTLQAPDGIRRLDDQRDWVRQEIEWALEANRTVIPVLIDGATPIERHALRTVPRIEPFADRQVMHLETKRWDGDFAALVAALTRQGFRKRPAGDTSASPLAESLPAVDPDQVDDPPPSSRTGFPIRALAVGIATAAIMAIASGITEAEIPLLQRWDVSSTAIVRVLVIVIAGSGTFHVLRDRRRALSLLCAVVAGAGCAYAWYTYATKAGAPANVGDWLTWDGTLYILYLTGFALCAAALAAMIRVAAPRA
jgi:TIR domain